jgi:hypothetical protein
LDFDWFFYISKVHLNYSREEFYRSCPKEIGSLWESHIKFNGWKFKEDEDNKVYNVDDFPWL